MARSMSSTIRAWSERACFELYASECVDMDEAIEVSAKHPIAEFGLIELRPIVET